MILMTGFALDTVPFKTIYLHGLVRDTQGRKMSKSLGNNMDPLEVTANYGADAARMALIVGNTPGTDMRISEDKIKGYKHFANKLWNITRFILEQTEGADRTSVLTEVDKELRTVLTALITDVSTDIDEYRLYMAAEKLYHYTWNELAGTIIESSKPILLGDGEAAKASRKALLLSLLTDVVKILHPFIPFVTEEIWASLPHTEGLLMVAPWPKQD
jgi:valyl-tRNA synthetase